MRMHTRKQETTGSVRRNDLRSVAQVPRVGVVEDRSAVGGGEAGREKSCFRVLAPIRLLGKARGRGALEKLGAVLSKCDVEGSGRRVRTCRKPLKKVNLVQTMIELACRTPVRWGTAPCLQMLGAWEGPPLQGALL